MVDKQRISTYILNMNILLGGMYGEYACTNQN